jgi:shikimate dehydrogenase
MALVVATWIPEDDDAPPQTAADVLEIRLDALDPDRIPATIDAVEGPVLVACRRPEDGGRAELTEDQRRDRLATAIVAGVDLIDLERDASFRDELARQARATGARVVVSEHREDTPAPSTIIDELRAISQGADVAKLATTVDDEADRHRLLEASLEATAIGTPFALMGVGDELTRALAGPTGQALVYATPDEDPVPGQLPAELQARLPRRGPTPEPRQDHVLVGHPVGHSLSPPMQEAGFADLGIEARYRLIDAEPSQLERVLDGLAVTTNGGNVTAPHKINLCELADRTTDEAEAVGAANTFRFEDGDLLVHMTDGLGARDALQRAGVDLADTRALVLGAGGTARAVTHALADAGADIPRANRTRKRAERLAEAVDATVVDLEPDALAAALAEGDVVFNATPVDPPVPDEALAGTVAFDANYGHRADFAARARSAGATVLDGLALLVAQGVRSLAFWTQRGVDQVTQARMSTAARTRELERRYGADRS